MASLYIPCKPNLHPLPPAYTPMQRAVSLILSLLYNSHSALHVTDAPVRHRLHAHHAHQRPAGSGANGCLQSMPRTIRGSTAFTTLLLQSDRAACHAWEDGGVRGKEGFKVKCIAVPPPVCLSKPPAPHDKQLHASLVTKALYAVPHSPTLRIAEHLGVEVGGRHATAVGHLVGLLQNLIWLGLHLLKRWHCDQEEVVFQGLDSLTNSPPALQG